MKYKSDKPQLLHNLINVDRLKYTLTKPTNISPSDMPKSKA